MKKICIIGNSHVACLKLAWEALQGEPRQSYKITFFGSKGDTLLNTYFEDGAIRSSRKLVNHFFKFLSNGQEKIIISDYNCFVLVGLGVKFLKLIDLYVDYRSEKQASDILSPTFISDECLDLIIKRLFRDSAAKWIFQLLRLNCNQPIYLVPAPFPGESVSLTSKVWIELLKKEDVHALRANFEKAIKHAFDAEITILFPPEKLLHRSIMTKQEYARGAFNLEFTKQFDDHHFGHMNATYGQSILLTLFEETG